MLLFLTGCLKYGPVQTKYDDVDKNYWMPMSMYMRKCAPEEYAIVFSKDADLEFEQGDIHRQKSILIVRSKVLIGHQAASECRPKDTTKMESMTMLISYH